MRSKLVRCAIAVVTVSLCLVAAPVNAGSGGHGFHRVVLVNGLNASPSRTFDDATPHAFFPLGRPQAMGPRFEVTKRVTLKEVGGFLNASANNYGSSSAPPYTVEIRRATEDGRPDLGAPLAVRRVSDDRDAEVWRFEAARFKLKLRPGVYFAMFTARAPATFDNVRPAGVLGAWGQDELGNFLYQPGEMVVGFIDHVNQTSEVFPVHQGPFRIVAVKGWRHHH